MLFVILTLWDFVLCGIHPCAFAYWRCLKLQISIRVWRFFCFLNSFQGPSWGSFQFPLCDDSSAFGCLLSVNSHTSKPALPLPNSMTNPCSHALHCPADPNCVWVVVPALQRCWDMKFIPCAPGSCNGFSGIFTLAMVLLGKASPKNNDLKYHILECGVNLLVWHFEKYGQCLISFSSLSHWQTGHSSLSVKIRHNNNADNLGLEKKQ